MIEKKLDIWKVYDDGGVVCITTNGFVKSNSKAVMGCGVAKQALARYPNAAAMLGAGILQNGNVVQEICPRILAFPVKPTFGVVRLDKRNIVSRQRHRFMLGMVVPGWAMKADTEVIARSLYELYLLQGLRLFQQAYLPRPGCGAGELDWETEVKPLCRNYGDWLIVVHV